MIEYIVFFGLLAVGLMTYIAYLIQRGPVPKHNTSTGAALSTSQREYIKCESPIERKLFNALTFNGYVVYTQHRVGPYRGDLFIKPNLIIECDGKQYHTDKERDKRRDRFIKKQGYRVVRFPGSRINRDMKGILRRIEKELQKSR